MNLDKINVFFKSKRTLPYAVAIIIVSTLLIITFGFLNASQENRLQKSELSYEKRLENNPILAKLPHEEPFYSIEGRTEDGQVVLYVFSGIPLQRTKAIKKINQLEREASIKYKIIFHDFKNPLATKEKGGDDE